MAHPPRRPRGLRPHGPPMRHGISCEGETRAEGETEGGSPSATALAVGAPPHGLTSDLAGSAPLPTHTDRSGESGAGERTLRACSQSSGLVRIRRRLVLHREPGQQLVLVVPLRRQDSRLAGGVRLRLRRVQPRRESQKGIKVAHQRPRAQRPHGLLPGGTHPPALGG